MDMNDKDSDTIPAKILQRERKREKEEREEKRDNYYTREMMKLMPRTNNK